MEQMDITPKTEQEFLTMVEMHNLYHSHEAADRSTPNSSRGKYCRVCHMPLENTPKGLETYSRKGNTSVYEHHIEMGGFGTKKDEYDPLWYLAWFLKAREFNIVDALMRHRINQTHQVDQAKLREVFMRWFNPVYALRNNVKSQQWARAAYIYAQRVCADDETRRNASTDPEWALVYAKTIDRAPHDDTRDGACRYMATALQYAKDVDKGYHPTTLTKALETWGTSYEYLQAHYNKGKHPEMNAIIKARWVRDAMTGVKYAEIVGGEDDTREMILKTGDALGIFNYALCIDKQGRDDTRNAIIAAGEACRIFDYANQVDRCGRDDTRAAALTDPHTALEYALYVDKVPRDDTRTAACKVPAHAFTYAQKVDCVATDETRIAASKTAGTALEYALHIDNANPHDVTRAGACTNPETALQYARRVDGHPHPLTRWAVCAHSDKAYNYALSLGDKSECLKTAACRDASYAFAYAREVDKRPSNFTREAASFEALVDREYHTWEMQWYASYVPELFEGQPDMQPEVRTHGIKIYTDQVRKEIVK